MEFMYVKGVPSKISAGSLGGFKLTLDGTECAAASVRQLATPEKTDDQEVPIAVCSLMLRGQEVLFLAYARRDGVGSTRIGHAFLRGVSSLALPVATDEEVIDMLNEEHVRDHVNGRTGFVPLHDAEEAEEL